MADESLGKAVLELVADLNPLKRDLEEGKGEADAMAKSTASGFKSGITKAAVPAAAALGVLTIGLHKSVEAAIENQASEAKLAAAFKASGQNIDDYKDKIDKAEAASANLGFKSEDVKAALAQLVVATKNGGQAINMLGIAQDVARYKGINLSDASRMMTQTLAGSSRAARTLGIQLAPVTTATDALKSKTDYASTAAYSHAKAVAYLTDHEATAKEMVGLLTDKLGGQADAFSKTAEGAKEKMGAEFQLLEINIGNALIPILTKASAALASLSEFLVKHASIVKIVILVVGTLASAILLYTGYVKLAAAAQALWNGIMDANPIGLIVVAIAALVIAFVELWKHSQTFRDIIEGVWNDVTTATTAFTGFFTQTVPAAFQSVITWMTNTWSTVEGFVTKPFTDLANAASNGFGIPGDISAAFNTVMGWFNNTWSAVSGYISGVFTGIINDAENGFGLSGAIKSVWDGLKGWFNNTWSDVKGYITSPFTDLIKDASDGFGLGTALGNAWTTIKGAAKTAWNAVGGAAKAAFVAPINAVIGAIDAIKLPTSIHIKTWHGIPDGVSVGWSNPFHIPQLAQGGIVTRPTLALIGEAGPEAVVPLSHGGAGAGGTTINVTVNGVVGNHRDIAIKIGRELQNLQNRGLSFGLT